jgi:hypothetical protein
VKELTPEQLDWATGVQISMRLRDWSIIYHIVNDMEMEGLMGKGYVGCCEINQQCLCADVYASESRTGRDFAQTIAHELTHIAFDMCKRILDSLIEDHNSALYEQFCCNFEAGINIVADALSLTWQG